MKFFHKNYSKAAKNEYIVENTVLDKYLELKRRCLCWRILKALFNSLFAIFLTGLYYFDIYTDAELSYEYYQAGDTNWSIITFIIIFISFVFYNIGMFYSTRAEFGYMWNRKQYWCVFLKALSIFLLIERFIW